MKRKRRLLSLLLTGLLLLLPWTCPAEELSFPEAEHFEAYIRFLSLCADAGLEVADYRMEQDVYEMMEQLFLFDALPNVTFSIHYGYPEPTFEGYQLYVERGEDAFAGVENMYRALIEAADPACTQAQAEALARTLIESLAEEEDGVLMSAVDQGQWRYILSGTEEAVSMLGIPWAGQ